MSPLRVTWARTVAQILKSRATAMSVAVFMAAGIAILAFNLEAADGGNLSLSSVWALGVSQILPFLCAFVAMDVWSSELRTGRIDFLLTSPVRERDFAIGKFLGVWTIALSAIGMLFASSMLLLWIFSPSVFSGVMLVGFVPALFILALQSALWCSVAAAFSALFRNVTASICSSIAILVVVPRGIWFAMMAWTHEVRGALGEMPLDAHALDFASGAFSTGVVAFYVMASATALFMTSKTVSSMRLVGRGGVPARWSGMTAMTLSIVFSALAVLLAVQLDVRFNLPFGQIRNSFSDRTKRILSESDGEITITSYLPRSDRRFRRIAYFLRSLRRESESLGGVGIVLRFVDPRWDIVAAQRLVRRGVSENSVVFEKGRRMTTVSLEEGFGERLYSSALQRVATPPMRRNIYWSVGHGESSYDDYGSFGMSDIARDLAREGYVNRKIDFAAGVNVPGDCAMMVVAGAKDDFSRLEIGLVESYLRQGGRLLVLASAAERGGVTSMLPAWGLRSVVAPLQGARTLSGLDVIVSEFTGHELAAPLKGSRLVLGRPVAFTPSAVADAGAGKIDFDAIAMIDETVVAAAVERGGGVGSDIAVRPTRIVAVGDASFVMNGMLAARANANRDFFLNCVSYLSGSGTFGSGGCEAGVLTTEMDRAARAKFLLFGSIVVPLAVLVVMFFFASGWSRRE